MDDKMTVFYSKATGKITSLCSGTQSMAFFGDNEADISEVWDYLIADYNQELFSTYKFYKVDLTTLQIVHI